MSTRRHIPMKSGTSRWLAPLVFGAIWLAGCATTAEDVRSWARGGDFRRIIDETRKKDASAEVRAAAASELAATRNQTMIPELVELSRDPDPEVRYSALRGLGTYAGAHVYPAVLKRAGDDSEKVAAAAEQILTTWKEESLEYVLEALTDRNYRVRVAALQVLPRIQGKRVGEATCKAARIDDSVMVRREAAKALGIMRYAPCRMVLYRLKSGDPSTEVQLEAERALAKLGRTVTDLKLVLLPSRADLEKTSAPGGRIHSILERKLRAAGICELLASPESNGEDGEGPAAAVKIAQAVSASQALLIKLGRDANRLTVSLIRLDAGSGQVLQEEELTGYESKSDELAEQLGDLFLNRFNTESR